MVSDFGIYSNQKKKILKNNSIEQFDLIVDLQSKLRNTIILKQFPSKNFYSSTLNFNFCNVSKDYISTKFDLKNILINLEKLLDTKIPFKKYDFNQINEKYINEAKRLLPDDNYVGFSVTQGNEYRKKSWPIKKFINVAKKNFIIK